jgi:hypothetical protein
MQITGKIMRKPGLLLVAAIFLTAFAPLAQQDSTPLINLSVSAGYDGLFRESQWFPILVRISNDGDDVTGRLVVRPDRSGSAFTNTFSAPVDMPAGSRKSVFLYVTARSFANEVRVEFIDTDGIPLAEQSALLRHVLLQDQLHVVLTQATVGSVDVSSIHSGGFSAAQANWLVENIPDQSAALEAVDTILFSDIDTGTLSSTQRQVLGNWVAAGGHLIVTGGANWQATAAGVVDLLPLTPDGSDTVANLDALAALAGTNTLRGETIVATGALREDARILAETEDGFALVARREWGLGTIDYLAVDPLAQPLRSWPDLGELWFTLATSTSPRPSWARGLLSADRGANAVEVLPGLDLLPDVLPLCGFLAAYVALIGPLNYVVLNRINRREWAWLTIPVFILIFSGLAWIVGFNLRGNSATLSRMAVVESWPESEQAQMTGLVGLLSPRRSSYTLTMADGSLLRPISRSIQANPFAASVQASTDIQQADIFRADNFTVDASFIATFMTSGVIERPDISGQVSLFYQMPGSEGESGRWSIRGSVRNNSPETLSSPVILARGISVPLGESLLPGDIRTFDQPLVALEQEPPIPASFEYSTGESIARLSFSRFSRDATLGEQTIRDIMGESNYSTRVYSAAPGATAGEQELYRRQTLLSAFMQDHFLSTARGNNVYLAGWSDRTPLEVELEGAVWEPLDTTLHLIELDVDFNPPSGRVRIGADQFIWAARERTGLTIDMAPLNTTFQPGDTAVFRFTPLPEAVLNRVDTLHIELTLRSGSTLDLPLQLWNWQIGDWQTIELVPLQDRSTVRRLAIPNPQRFLGAQNAVEVRLAVDETAGFLNLSRLIVEQEGQF